MVAWKLSNQIWSDDVDCGPVIIFSGTTAGTDPRNYAPFVWHTIDLKPLGVAADANFADIIGSLVITHGTNAGIANLACTFRTPGSTLHEGNYQMQSIEPWVGGGQRDPQSVRVALVNGSFQFYWRKESPAGTPDAEPGAGGSNYLLNLRLVGWGNSASVSTPDLLIKVPSGGLNMRVEQL